MTTLHPTPEERYEVAWALAKGEELRYTEAWLRDKSIGASPDRINFLQAAMIAAIREAEAAGEAKSDDVLIRVLASLAAAISLLERMPKAKKAAPSDKVFEQMLIDYRNALEAGRTFIRAHTDKENSDD